MPNWANNVVIIEHDDPAMIDRVVDSFKRGKLLQEFVPCPQEMIDTFAGSCSDEQEQKQLELQEQVNIEKYGYSNWYDWCVANWGTKWDVGGNNCPEPIRDGNSIELSFVSAWSPPTDAYAAMQEQGFRIIGYYYEPGMQFAGIWEDGYDEYYEGWGSAKGAAKMLPVRLDEMFEIVENQRMWEED